MSVAAGQRVYVPGLGMTGEVTEVVFGLNVVKFRADKDGLVRSVDASAVTTGASQSEKAAPKAKDKARQPGRNKGADAVAPPKAANE